MASLLAWRICTCKVPDVAPSWRICCCSSPACLVVGCAVDTRCNLRNWRNCWQLIYEHEEVFRFPTSLLILIDLCETVLLILNVPPFYKSKYSPRHDVKANDRRQYGGYINMCQIVLYLVIISYITSVMIQYYACYVAFSTLLGHTTFKIIVNT